MKANQIAFKEKLEEQYSWPAVYMFKFIVPEKKEAEVIKLFPNDDLKKKSSSGGKYISFTATRMMQSSDEIINIYNKANNIEGIIAL